MYPMGYSTNIQTRKHHENRPSLHSEKRKKKKKKKKKQKKGTRVSNITKQIQIRARKSKLILYRQTYHIMNFKTNRRKTKLDLTVCLYIIKKKKKKKKKDKQSRNCTERYMNV